MLLWNSKNKKMLCSIFDPMMDDRNVKILSHVSGIGGDSNFDPISLPARLAHFQIRRQREKGRERVKESNKEESERAERS